MLVSNNERIIRLPEVIKKTGLSKSTIFLRIKNNSFPKQVSLGGDGRAVGWLESSITNWISSLINEPNTNSRAGVES